MSFIFKIVLYSILLQVVLSDSPNTVLNATIKGTFSWELILDIDNSNNSGTVSRIVEVITTLSVSYKSLKTSLLSGHVSSSLAAQLGGTFHEVLNADVKTEVNAEIRSSYEKITEKRTDYKVETRKIDTYEVGPHSTLVLYRLVYNGPGVQYETDSISSHPVPMEDVAIDVTVRQLSFLRSFDVVYTNDSVSRPDDVIKMAYGEDENISYRIPAWNCVWLVPVWETKVDEAATGIEIVIQHEENSNYKNLGEGTWTGTPNREFFHYRYVKMLKRYRNNNERISDVGLWRSENPMNLTASGWQYKTIDINWYRGNDYLYLVWNTMLI